MRLAEFLQQQINTGVTRAELARQIGVHPSYITRWLSGTLPERTQCHQIAEALRVPVNVVLRMAGREAESDVQSAVDELAPAKAAALAIAARVINGLPEESLSNFAQAFEHLGRAFQATATRDQVVPDEAEVEEEEESYPDAHDLYNSHLSVLASAYEAPIEAELLAKYDSYLELQAVEA